MKKIQAYTQFKNDQSFQETKMKSIDQMMKDPLIIQVNEACGFTRQDIENNWITFLDYQEDHHLCIGCQRLSMCPKSSKGLVKQLSYESGQISSSLAPCRFGKESLEDSHILSHILLKNVSDRILLTKSSDITILNDEGNARSVLNELSDYLEHPQAKGIYLYGRPGVGKSTFMGLLVRNLAKKGYKCGFVHFPTFLMDLKSAFNEAGIENSLKLLKELDALIIDDLGGENVTSWSRDEILSGIISYRLQNGKATFFTSEYSLAKLASVYMTKKEDKIKVERLVDRIKAGSRSVELKGKDLR